MSAVMAARSNCGAKPQSSRAGARIERKRPRFRDGLAHGVNAIVDGKSRHKRADLRSKLGRGDAHRRDIIGVTIRSRAPSASISAMVARMASGMYIMGSRASAFRKQL